MTKNWHSSFFYSLQGVVALLFAYGFVQSSMRLSASWNLGENDPVSVLNIQNFWSWVMSGGQVFDLLAMGLSEIFGPTAFVFQVLRYGLLTIALIFVFLITRRISNSGFWALLTVESYALIYQISWRFHEGFTYPLVTIIAVSGTFWAFLRLENAMGNPRGYWVFAFFILFGMIAGFWYFAFSLALFLSLIISRQGSFRAKVMLALPIIVFPVMYIWLSIVLPYASSSQIQLIEYDNVYASLSGGGSAALKVVAYLSPFLPVVILLFGFSIRKSSVPPSPMIRIIKISSLLGVTGVVIAAVLRSEAAYGEHALMPLFFLTPIWIVDRVRRAAPSIRLIKLYSALCLTLMMVAFVARAANLYVLDPVCKRCYFGVPYEGLARELSLDFPLSDNARVFTDDERLSGHLRTFWQGTRPFFMPQDIRHHAFDLFQFGPLTDAAGPLNTPTLFVWDATKGETRITELMKFLRIDFEEARGLLDKAHIYQIPWRHTWRQTGYRTSTWKAVLVKQYYDKSD